MSIRLFLMLSILILLGACKERQESPRPANETVSSPAPALVRPPEPSLEKAGAPLPKPEQNLSSRHRLLADTVPLQRFELPTEALAVWRRFAPLKPTLLLLSNDPFLVPVPESLRSEVAALAASATADQMARRSGLQHSDPLLLSEMSIDAALRQGWFGRLAWAIPLRDSEQALSQEVLQQQFTEAGLADAGELATLAVAEEHRITGTLRGIPLVAATLPHLPAIEGPAVVHLDLSYFQPLYKNEVSTPLLGIVQNTLTALRDRQIEVLAVTFSYGNRDRRIALDVRFLGELLEKLFEKPERLDLPLPDHWQQQANALYLANFFQKEEIRRLHEAQEQALPQAGWVKFNLYRSAAEHKEGTRALDYLAQAVRLDPLFALEYLDLAQMAYEKQRPDEALRMLRLAEAQFPGDPQILLQISQLSGELGERETARQVVQGLERRQWSPVYYPEMGEYLKGFGEYLKTGKVNP